MKWRGDPGPCVEYQIKALTFCHSVMRAARIGDWHTAGVDGKESNYYYKQAVRELNKLNAK